MRFHRSNRKLGPNVLSMSRPMPSTCPDSCALKHNGCYAERGALRTHNDRGLWEEWVEPKPWSILDALKEREERQPPLAVRLHVAGDFAHPSGGVDYRYAAMWADVLYRVQRLRPSGRLPAWTYTHCLDAELVHILSPVLHLFASVHGQEDVERAREAGFRNMALILPQRPHEWRNEHGNSPWYTAHGMKFLVCPEQRGKLNSCEDCGWCFTGSDRGVAFLTHDMYMSRGKRLSGGS